MTRKGFALPVLALAAGVLLAPQAGTTPAVSPVVAPAPTFRLTPEPRPAPAQRSPQPSTISEYLQRDWNLSSHYADTVSEAIHQAADRYKVDPVLLMAVAAAESSFNHIGNPDGNADPREPFGIMQVAGKFHAEKFPEGKVRPTTVAENIFLGANILREYLDLESGNERRALLRYNGSLHLNDRYYRRIRELRRTLEAKLQALNTGNV